jgi:uncharacterized RDD family membrane protein YckC
VAESGVTDLSGMQPQYASFWSRAVAALVDFPLACLFSVLFVLVVTVAAVVIAGVMGALTQTEQEIGEALALAASVISQWLYFGLSESSRWQATLGKRMLGLRVTDLEGNRIDFQKATNRYFAKYLSALPAGLGFVKVLLAENRQALHDSLAGTLVLVGPAHTRRGADLRGAA